MLKDNLAANTQTVVSPSHNKASLKSPFKVGLWIADSCNLSCLYCYAAPFSGRLMEIRRACELIDEFVELEVVDLIIAGGEPFLHPDIFELLDRAVRSPWRVVVLSNGVLLDQGIRDRLVDNFAYKGNFVLQISLDSAQPSINDKTRGMGNVVLQNLRALACRGLALQVAIVLTQHNIHTASLIIDKLYPAIKCFHFMRVQKSEQTLKDPSLLVTGKQTQDFWLGLVEKAKNYPPDLRLPSLRITLRSNDEECDVPQNIKSTKASFKVETCMAAVTVAHIDARFNVFGCDIAKDHSIIGNVYDRRFSDVWHSPEATRLRNGRYPPCYKIKDPWGNSLEQCLKDEYKD
jgi:MoaA/NifB/PqqE/SkfB family radical SAM enzyme